MMVSSTLWRQASALGSPLVVMLLLACEPVGEAPPAESGESAVAEHEMLMATARIPGLSLATIQDGRLATAEFLGVVSADSGEPVRRDTLFEAASLSKPVFATAVLRLAERGEVDLDRPLHELVDYERLAHDPRARLLTARLVLSHQTGLPNWGGETLDFQAEPGEGFGYSGEGYVYLQRAMEELTGLTVDELVRREVFDPLGMEQSRFSWPEGTELPLAVPHDEGGSPQPKREQHEGNAAASLHTTAQEFALFLGAWLNGELLRAETLDEALEPAVWLDPPEGSDARPTPRQAWGLGWGILQPEAGGGPIYWHWGDNGPFKAFAAFDRAAGTGLAYFANSMNGLAIAPALLDETVGSMDGVLEGMGYARYDEPGFEERLDGVAAESAGRYGEAAAAFRLALVADPDDEETARRVEWLTDLLDLDQRPVQVPASVLERYAGSYGPRTIAFEDGKLFYQRQGGQRFELVPLSETLFALDGLVIFRLEVALDAAGRPTKLVGHYVNGSVDESPRDAG